MTLLTKNPQEIEDFLLDFRLEPSSRIFEKDTTKQTTVIEKRLRNCIVKKFINEFWTAKQRQGHSLHEISYRACFKPQLPSFFIRLLTLPKAIVYDPFSGRGTTPIEAALQNRNVISNDINPLSQILTEPRLNPPYLKEVEERLAGIELEKKNKADIDLSMFYHSDTEGELASLRSYLEERKKQNEEDFIDKWIRMVATNRLTGHSSGFFSVYTLPPNQAVTPERQKTINEIRNQIPTYRDVKKLIIRKSKQLLRDLTLNQRRMLREVFQHSILLTEDVRNTPQISSGSVQLVVTSPPFLDIVQYSVDNWLRCWFNGIDVGKISKEITVAKTVSSWSNFVGCAFKELYRVVKSDGWIAFEVGEVRRGSIELDEIVVPLGTEAGFKVLGIVINNQKFTKTANIWGINNNHFGTNTNRIVLFHKN